MRTNLILVVLSVFLIIGCAKKEAPEAPAETAPEMMAPSERFLYTSTNDPAGNHVIAMAIGGDGS